jgi:hypothetical protein
MSIGSLIMCSPLSNGAYWVTIFNMDECPLQGGCSRCLLPLENDAIGEVLNVFSSRYGVLNLLDPFFHAKLYVIPLVKCKLLL